MGLLYTGTLPPPKGGKPAEDWEPVPQLLFRSTAFGDEIDRPLKRSNGAWTYFAADLAYHLDKFRRGFRLMVDVWGADHGGYVKRMLAAVRALTQGEGTLDVRLCQLVNLLDGGKPMKMSKRAGRIVTLRDVVDEVGRDVVRFIMLTRKNDAPLDFDFAKVTEQSKDNPVFYVQYAHARICSVLRNAREAGVEPLARAWTADLGQLADPAELALLREMALFPRVLEGAALQFEPHRVAFYLYDLASAFHGLWARGNEDPSCGSCWRTTRHGRRRGSPCCWRCAACWPRAWAWWACSPSKRCAEARRWRARRSGCLCWMPRGSWSPTGSRGRAADGSPCCWGWSCSPRSARWSATPI